MISSRRRLVWLLVVCLAACVACHRPRRPPPKPDEPSRGRQVRLLTPDGEATGSYRLRGRSAHVFDDRGVRTARARVLPDRVEVLDRAASVELLIVPEAEGRGEGTGAVPTHSALFVDGEQQALGRLLVWPGERVVRLSARGATVGEVVVHTDDGEVVAEVYGAEGTDLLARVYAAGRHTVEVADPDGLIIARLEGAPIEPWIAAALRLTSPLGDRDTDQGYFRAGLLAYLRRL